MLKKIFDGLVKSIALGVAISAITATVEILFEAGIIPESISDFRIIFGILIYASAISTMIIIPAVIVIGIPVTFMLRSGNWEGQFAYMVAGAIGGMGLPIIVSDFLDSSWHSFLRSFWFVGGLSGVVIGRAWWIYYRREAGLRRSGNVSWH